MEIAEQIKHKLDESYQPLHLELHNESAMHAGPATDSHFKLIMVSAAFDGLAVVKRHQGVYKCLKEELDGPVHALALHLYSQAEWEAEKGVPDSPLCAGKNK